MYWGSVPGRALTDTLDSMYCPDNMVISINSNQKIEVIYQEIP